MDANDPAEEASSAEAGEYAGDKMCVDIVAGLLEKNCVHVLAQIFSYLPVQDLIRVGAVSQSWRKALQSDSKANDLKRLYLTERRKLRQSVGQVRVQHSSLLWWVIASSD